MSNCSHQPAVEPNAADLRTRLVAKEEFALVLACPACGTPVTLQPEYAGHVIPILLAIEPDGTVAAEFSCFGSQIWERIMITPRRVQPRIMVGATQP